MIQLNLCALIPAALVLGALAGVARGENTDISLEKEVTRYLEGAEGALSDHAFHVSWKDGLTFETSDKRFKVVIGGQVQVDWFFKEGDARLNGDFPGIEEDGVTFRRIRLHGKGTVYEVVDFSVDLEFAGSESAVTGVTTTTDGDGDVTSVTTTTTRVGSVQLRNVFLGLKKLPVVGNLRVGHFKEPIGLDELTSSLSTLFMERSPLMAAFAPAFNTGVMAFDTELEERLTWAVGVFRQTSEAGGGADEDGAYALSLRVTGLPLQDRERNLLVHLGASFSMRDPSGGRTRLRARPSVATGPRVLDTGNIANDSYVTLGLEVALVYGPFSIQGEYLMADFDAPGDPSFGGFYVAASFWITGESRPYEASKATFGRARPKSDFRGGAGGWGAWEVAIRLTDLDLDDGAILGGGLLDWVFGIRWHLNASTRVLFDVVFADVERSGKLTAFQMRFQIGF
ncbi:MAG: OprO/OprP family phosphate-selective porin [Planctomycetaceae bacterium]